MSKLVTCSAIIAIGLGLAVAAVIAVRAGSDLLQPSGTASPSDVVLERFRPAPKHADTALLAEMSAHFGQEDAKDHTPVDVLEFHLHGDGPAARLLREDAARFTRITLQPGGHLALVSWQPGTEGYQLGTLVVADETGLLRKATKVTLELVNLPEPTTPARFEWNIPPVR